MARTESEEGRQVPREAAPAGWARLGLDLFERGFVLTLFAWLAWSNLVALGAGANLFNLFQVGAEGLNVVFILIRKRATSESYRPKDWAVALAAASGALLARPAYPLPLGDQSLNGRLFGPLNSLQHLGTAYQEVALVLILLGLFAQVWSKLTLRRSFGIVPANRGLTTRGPYHYVRHPMYLGYLMGWLGFFLLNPTPWNALVYTATLACQWVRIGAEERVLSDDPGYAGYSAEVRYRVIPGVW